VTWGHVVGTRLKRSFKAARLKQKLLLQPIRLTIELNTKSKLEGSTLCKVGMYPYGGTATFPGVCDGVGDGLYSKCNYRILMSSNPIELSLLPGASLISSYAPR